MTRAHEWVDCDDPVDAAHVRAAGRSVGVALPEDFVPYAQHYHGGHPKHNRFVYPDEGGTAASGLSHLLSFNLAQEWNFVWQNENPPEELPAGLVIIGEDGGGGLVCFDYRTDPDHPPVVFWSNDTPSADTVASLAPTFTALLRTLQPPLNLDDLMKMGWGEGGITSMRCLEWKPFLHPHRSASGTLLCVPQSPWSSGTARS